MSYRSLRPQWTAAAFLAFAAFVSTAPARGQEFIDGNNPPTVRNNMHSCPAGSILTGIDVATNRLLCAGPFVSELQGVLTVNEQTNAGTAANQWPPDATTRAAYNFPGSTTMHWCGTNRFLTGINVGSNIFNCSELSPGGVSRNYVPRLGNLTIDTGTVRNGLRACPRGTVLVGARFDQNLLLCGELLFCEDNTHCPGALDSCEKQSIGGSLFLPVGVCRKSGHLVFFEDPGCRGDSTGLLTERSGNFADFSVSTDNGPFCDDESESLSLSNVPAGTIIRIYDSNSGSTANDWTQVLVKQAANQCITGGFENSVNGPTFKIDYHDGAGDLNDDVSLVVLRSALIDFAGRCVDVNMNDNSVQIFGCHGNANQSFFYENGAIRGFNNLCLEAVATQIATWPALPAGTPRSATVRMANCNNSFNQSWTITESGQIRMFADMCLDIRGGTSADNAALQIFPCHGNANQRWLSSF